MDDELVKRLRNRRICIQQSGSLDDFPLLKEAADAIEELLPFKKQVEKGMGLLDKADELLRAIKPLWTPVTKGLPSVDKEVYVTDGEYIARAKLLDEVFPGDKPCWSYSGLGEITHWCEQIPLPQKEKH
jgi:hypothetical protein